MLVTRWHFWTFTSGLSLVRANLIKQAIAFGPPSKQATPGLPWHKNPVKSNSFLAREANSLATFLSSKGTTYIAWPGGGGSANCSSISSSSSSSSSSSICGSRSSVSSNSRGSSSKPVPADDRFIVTHRCEFGCGFKGSKTSSFYKLKIVAPVNFTSPTSSLPNSSDSRDLKSWAMTVALYANYSANGR